MRINMNISIFISYTDVLSLERNYSTPVDNWISEFFHCYLQFGGGPE